ncbi:MAG: 2Fe-2S iron-sulfur cluster-binding protein, partial [Candidatus Saliniplasma sp.]
MKVRLDGKEIEVEEDKTILEAAEGQGIDIPTLCYHKGLESYGQCRMCIVEIENDGDTEIDTSCTRKIENGMVIHTDSEKLRKYRRLNAELLLARVPDSDKVKKVAEQVGVDEVRFEEKNDDCILCGLCVRACRDEIGESAISFVDRGFDRKVTTPFEINSEECIGCGACAEICPTDCIEIEDEGNIRYVKYFNTEVELLECDECGKRFAPEKAMKKVQEKFPWMK